MYQNTRITTLITQIDKWNTLGGSEKASPPTSGVLLETSIIAKKTHPNPWALVA